MERRGLRRARTGRHRHPRRRSARHRTNARAGPPAHRRHSMGDVGRPGAGPCRPRRHRSPARHVPALRGLLSRIRLARSARADEDDHRLGSRRADPGSVSQGSAEARRVQPARRPARARHPRAPPSRGARGREKSPHGHAPGPGGGEHRLVRLPVSLGAIASWPRRPFRPRIERGRGADVGRARARAGLRAPRQRARLRLQEPLSEHHPYVSDRPARPPRVPGPRRRSDRGPRTAPRSHGSRGYSPSCSTSSSPDGRSRRRQATSLRARRSRSS